MLMLVEKSAARDIERGGAHVSRRRRA